MSDNDTHRLVGGGTHRRSTDGPGPAEVYERGDTLTPTEAELDALPDRFEPLATGDESDASGDESAGESEPTEGTGTDEEGESADAGPASDDESDEDEGTAPSAADVEDADYQALRSLAADFDDVNGNWGEDRLRAELRDRAEG